MSGTELEGSPSLTHDPSGEQGRQRAIRYWRAVVFASTGDGLTRRRPSDAVRMGVGTLVAIVATLLVSANTRAELRVSSFLTPPPHVLDWLVTAVWIVGFYGVVVTVVVAAVVGRNVPLLRDGAASALLAWLACVLAGWLGGSSGGRPVNGVPEGVSTGYPSVKLAVATAVVMVAYPYLSRALRRATVLSAILLVLASVVHGAALPFDAAASVAIGYTVGAGVRLLFGSPMGMPSVADVVDALADLGVDGRDVTRTPEQVWGVATFTARDADSRQLDISVYGRDAADAEVLGKTWRFVFFRDSGSTAQITRLQQVEHEAYLALRSGQVGVRVPEVVTAGPGGPSNDALLVTVPPDGRRLASMEPASVSEGTMQDLFTALAQMRSARLAHSAISGATVVVDDSGCVGLRDFRLASSGAPPERLDADVGAALVALALVAGIAPVAEAAARCLDSESLTAALLHVQPSALVPSSKAQLKDRKGFLEELRSACAAAAGIEVPGLAKLQRTSWSSVLLAIGSVIGMWALLGVFVNVAASFDTLKGASWDWVALVFVLSLLPPVVVAWALVASLFDGVPLVQATLLQESQTFTGMIGSAVASMAVTVRFFQRRGRDVVFATTTSVLASTASWLVKGLLFLVALPLAWGNFHFATASDASRSGIVNLLLYVVIGVGVLLGVVIVLPKLRRLAWSRLKPQLVKAVGPMRALAAEPRKLVSLLAGNAGAQLLTALALSASLRAFHYQLGLASIIIVITVASMLGGVSPVPGGVGVVEAGLIAGLVAAGVPEDVATATVFVQRLFTAYLPPLWGWLSLMWLGRHELI